MGKILACCTAMVLGGKNKRMTNVREVVLQKKPNFLDIHGSSPTKEVITILSDHHPVY